MSSGLFLCCVAAMAAANPVPMDNDTESYHNHGVQDIVNGTDSRYGLYDFILSVKEDGHHVCGASLISDRRALTAAHCVDRSSSYTVQAGELHFDHTSGFERVAVVNEIIQHPEYNRFVNDIAILKFDPIPLSTEIQPIGMITAADGNLVNERCYIAGWGKTSGQSDVFPRVLQFADMYVMDNSDCRKYLNDIHDTDICVQNFQQKKTDCAGDSGGPLKCFVNGEAKLAGVSSSGGPGCFGITPSTYMRVSEYQDWIARNM